MGGAAPISSAKGSRKAVDAALNLVPFIDLLSCCISFLLITAVWAQLGTIPVGSDRHDGNASSQISVERMPTFTLYVDGAGYVLSRSTGQQESIPRRGAEYDDDRLAGALARAHAEVPDQTSLTIKAADAVAYTNVVRAMDVAIGQRFNNLEVGGGGGI